MNFKIFLKREDDHLALYNQLQGSSLGEVVLCLMMGFNESSPFLVSMPAGILSILFRSYLGIHLVKES
jgi:hypothetical protein